MQALNLVGQVSFTSFLVVPLATCFCRYFPALLLDSEFSCWGVSSSQKFGHSHLATKWPCQRQGTEDDQNNLCDLFSKTEVRFSGIACVHMHEHTLSLQSFSDFVVLQRIS
eukprot:700807-Amphidinium_carterae.1